MMSARFVGLVPCCGQDGYRNTLYKHKIINAFTAQTEEKQFFLDAPKYVEL